MADRFDVTGARWGLAGAEAILKLRAIRSNGDSEFFRPGSSAWALVHRLPGHQKCESPPTGDRLGVQGRLTDGLTGTPYVLVDGKPLADLTPAGLRAAVTAARR